MITFAPQAERDLDNFIAYLAERNRGAANRMRERIADVLSKLDAREFDGPSERLKNGQVVRSWPIPPIRIYYQRESDSLQILRVYHQARRPLTRRREPVQ